MQGGIALLDFPMAPPLGSTSSTDQTSLPMLKDPEGERETATTIVVAARTCFLQPECVLRFKLSLVQVHHVQSSALPAAPFIQTFLLYNIFAAGWPIALYRTITHYRSMAPSSRPSKTTARGPSSGTWVVGTGCLLGTFASPTGRRPSSIVPPFLHGFPSVSHHSFFTRPLLN